MVRTLLHALAALAVVLCVNTIIDLTLLPPFWGSGEAWGKYAELGTNPERFNALVIGNSKTDRGVVPSVLDGISDRGTPLRFMNMGVSAITGPEELYILRTLHFSGIRPRLLLIQIIPIGAQGPSTLRSARSRYFLNVLTMAHTLRGMRVSPTKSRNRVIAVYMKNYMKKILHFNMLNEILFELKRKSNAAEVLGPERDGFFALDWLDEQTETARNTRIFLAKNPHALAEVKQYVKKAEEADCNQFSVKAHLALLKTLKREGEATGARVVFFQGVPNLSEQTECVTRAFKSADVLPPFRTDDFPALYQPEMYYDNNHLNLRGAMLFSTILRQKLDTLLSGT